MGFEMTTVCGGGLYDPFFGLPLVLPFALWVARVRYVWRGRRFIALDLSA